MAEEHPLAAFLDAQHTISDDNMHPHLAHAIDQLDDEHGAALLQQQQQSEASPYEGDEQHLPHQYKPQSYELESNGGNGSSSSNSEPLTVGVAFGALSQLLPRLHEASQQYFDFLVVDLAHPRPNYSTPHTLAFTEPDTLMCASTWASRVVGHISTWLSLDEDLLKLPGASPRNSDPVVPAASVAAASAFASTSTYFERRTESEQAFQREISWAAHLSLPAVLVTPPASRTTNPNLARCVSSALLQAQGLQMWIEVPLIAQSKPFDMNSTDSAEQSPATFDAADPWRVWNEIRNMCESNRRLGVALQLTHDVPEDVDQSQSDLTDSTSSYSMDAEDYILSRWNGEPVKCVIVETDIFLFNKKGYPVLSKPHQHVVRRMFERNVQWVLRDSNSGAQVSIGNDAPASANANVASLGLQPYQYYLRHLFQSYCTTHLSKQNAFEVPYRDYLQAPLQPLQDNLESGVYEVFERDPIKYKLYEQAVARALVDMFAKERTAEQCRDDQSETNASPESPQPQQVVPTVLVVGAGRGPLVRCVLRAGVTVGMPLRVFALEKNPNAVVTLESLKLYDEMFRDVQIISADMRNWQGPDAQVQFADILVSELLGSFGDNELSPECLDGALKFLKPTGISIPDSSCSYLVPISSSKLWNEVDALDSLESMETSYVTCMHNYYRMSPRLQPCFKFVHRVGPQDRQSTGNEEQDEMSKRLPSERTEGGWTETEHPALVKATRAISFHAHNMNSDDASSPSSSALSSPSSAFGAQASSTPNNSRHASLSFPIPLAATLHGFAGYFTSILYQDIELSIVPEKRYSHGMFSWFPLYFPLRAPITVPSGSIVCADFWRRTSTRKVWYEWALTSPSPSPIHNPNGRSSFIGL